MLRQARNRALDCIIPGAGVVLDLVELGEDAEDICNAALAIKEGIDGYRGDLEEFNAICADVVRKTRSYKCSKCHKQGHNVRTCRIGPALASKRCAHIA